MKYVDYPWPSGEWPYPETTYPMDYSYPPEYNGEVHLWRKQLLAINENIYELQQNKADKDVAQSIMDEQNLMTMDISQLQDDYSALSQRLNELHAEVDQNTKDIEELKGGNA